MSDVHMCGSTRTDMISQIEGLISDFSRGRPGLFSQSNKVTTVTRPGQTSINIPLWTEVSFLRSQWRTVIRAVPSRRPASCFHSELDDTLLWVWSDELCEQEEGRDSWITCLNGSTLELNKAPGEKEFTLCHNVHPSESGGALRLILSLMHPAHNVSRHPVGDSQLETASGNPHHRKKPTGWGFLAQRLGDPMAGQFRTSQHVLNNSGATHVLHFSIRSGELLFCLETGIFDFIAQSTRGSCSPLVPCGIASAWYREGKFQGFYTKGMHVGPFGFASTPSSEVHPKLFFLGLSRHPTGCDPFGQGRCKDEHEIASSIFVASSRTPLCPAPLHPRAVGSLCIGLLSPCSALMCAERRVQSRYTDHSQVVPLIMLTMRDTCSPLLTSARMVTWLSYSFAPPLPAVVSKGHNSTDQTINRKVAPSLGRRRDFAHFSGTLRITRAPDHSRKPGTSPQTTIGDPQVSSTDRMKYTIALIELALSWHEGYPPSVFFVSRAAALLSNRVSKMYPPPVRCVDEIRF